MLERTLQTLTNAETIAGSPYLVPISGISIDTRTLSQGDLFVALTAVRDGHDFIPAAIVRGVAALLVSKPLVELPPIPDNVWVVQVPDCTKALLEIGVWFRENVLRCPVIAVTGSYAKTSVKTMAAEVLKELGNGLVSEKNYNNHLGVPLTLATAQPANRFALFELGMNHFGEIRTLTETARPTIGLITHIGRAHIEYFGSEEAIAKAKGELFEAMTPAGVRLVNLDDPYILALAKKYPGAFDLGYTLSNDNFDFKGRILRATPLEKDEHGCYGISLAGTELHSSLPGRFQQYNLLAAATIGIALDIPLPRIAKRLRDVRAVPMRGQLLHFDSITLIRDEYNASLHSMKAGLELLNDQSTAKRRIAVLGDIFELGEQVRNDHETLAEYIVEANPSVVYLCGAHCRWTFRRLQEVASQIKVMHSDSVEEIAHIVSQRLQPGDAILVKGSRGMAMERISNAILEIVENFSRDRK
ncbi:MAG: UDP-N-acetylmuramoyl-tripeptide--D-alanyl-D-alanine ligase [bacterium]|nr:UDP-N-acetylmuramoyl-tripeptide--D-alanyl-D-alanine ligase [bacterium]